MFGPDRRRKVACSTIGTHTSDRTRRPRDARSRNASRMRFARLAGREVLEQRHLLAADSVSGLLDFSQLQVDPDSYEASSVLVRFAEEVVLPQSYLKAHENRALRGARVDQSLELVPGLQKLQLRADSQSAKR